MNNAAQPFIDEFEIRRLIENWVVWRDSGADFDRFATLWHPEGRMIATWAQVTGAEFVARGKAAFENGSKALHLLGGTSVDIAADRAYAQTKVTIMVRGEVHGVEVDVTCFSRFCDFLERVDGRWLLYLRQCAYDLDQMIPTQPGRLLELDRKLLDSFPEGYRHMAYMQTQAGIQVAPDLPGMRGPQMEAAREKARTWLAGGAI
ncbi:MAG TPA: nuclear transport factor 2 family protein [Caulobacteraceae bacterium]|jgi:hypothetical protein|nr:nuclear transport factor 2 family protein [Caulobacteraceae bacterium]